MMKSLGNSPLMRQRTVRGQKGGVIAVLLAFLIGVVCGLGSLFAVGYAFLTQLKIKDMINATTQTLDVSFDYTAYITEEYAEKTVLNAVGDAVKLVAKPDSCLNDLNGVSPFIGKQVGNAASMLEEKLGLTLVVEGNEGLMNKPFKDLPEFFMNSLYETELCAVLSSSTLDMLNESNDMYEILLLFSYGEEDVDYTIVDGNVVMAEGKTPTKIGELLGVEGYEAKSIAEKIMCLKISDVIEIKGEAPAFYYAIQDWKIGDLNDGNKINSLTLTQILGEQTMQSNYLLKNLKDSTMATIGSDIANLTVLQVFGEQAFEADGTTLKGTWRYMLIDEQGNLDDCKISEFDKMVTNMQRNVQSASLNELAKDGIAALDQNTLDTDIMYELEVHGQKLIDIDPAKYDNKAKIGDLTIIQLGSYMGEMISSLNRDS